MDEPVIEVFSRSRANLMKIYEILKCCIEPLNLYQLGNQSRISTAHGNDDELVFFLVEKGFLSTLTPKEYMKRGNYMQSYRKPSKTVNAYYKTSQTGFEAIKQFERLIDLLCFRMDRIRRFSE